MKKVDFSSVYYFANLAYNCHKYAQKENRFCKKIKEIIQHNLNKRKHLFFPLRFPAVAHLQSAAALHFSNVKKSLAHPTLQ